MGHYYSEMHGEPFTSFETLTNFELAESALDKKKLPYESIVSFKKEWITTDPKRVWYEISYIPKPVAGCNYVTTLSCEEISELK